MSAPVCPILIFESAGVATASSGNLVSLRGSICTRCSCASITAGATTGVSGGMTCLFRRSLEVSRPRGMENGPGGGCTGARGRGGMSVRGTTGGGGLDPVGWPSASRNLRMRSSSDSTGARSIGSAADGLVADLRSRSSCLFFASPALLASNLNSAATAISRMKRRFSMCMVRSLKS